jgi:SAM-dependent methyltransferase
MSFGTIAEEYNRYRPGPTSEVVEWLLPPGARTVVDLGAGTGALTRLLVGLVPQVFSIEPDDRMRAVLAMHNPGATALPGRGDAIPLADGSADAVLVASAWHWMDIEPTLAEIARVLRPRGRLGVVWAGPDRRVPWLGTLLGRARSAVPEHLAHGWPASADPAASSDDGASERAAGDCDDGLKLARHRFLIPEPSPFTPPEFTEIRWSQSMTIDDLVGLAGTYSSVITLPAEQRVEALQLARSLFESLSELASTGQLDVPFRAACWRTNRTT